MNIGWKATNGRKRNRNRDIRDSCDRLVLDIAATTPREATRLAELRRELNDIYRNGHTVMDLSVHPWWSGGDYEKDRGPAKANEIKPDGCPNCGRELEPVLGTRSSFCCSFCPRSDADMHTSECDKRNRTGGYE